MHHNTAVAWVYNLEEYQQIFNLTENDLSSSILEFPAGMGSFNAQMHALGKRVISGDVFYEDDSASVERHTAKAFARYAQFLKDNPDRLTENSSAAVDAVIAGWQVTYQQFLEDYEQGWQQQRYQALSLPSLPFEDHQFDLALCSDLVFQQSMQSVDQVEKMVSELSRVAKELRIFPLLNEQGDISDHLGPIMLQLQQLNFGVEVKEVPYQVLSGSNAMLRIWAVECKVN